MFRKITRVLLVAVTASLLLSPLAEAAGKKSVRHRPRHSSRVSASAAPAPQSTSKRPAHGKKRASASTSRTKRHRASTKPR